MENDSVTPDSPKPNSPPQATRDPLIRYSVFAALGCAAVCMIFTVLYIFSYSLDSTLSFERHFDAYLASGNTGNLSTVLGLHMAQNRMFLQSCGMVAGIFFACLGLALFLVGIQGTVDATGQVRDYSTSVRRLAPGGVILLASMIFVGVSAMHPIDLTLSPVGATAASASTVQPAIAPTATQPTATQPASAQPSTLSHAQPAPQIPASIAAPTTTAAQPGSVPQSPQLATQSAPLAAPTPARLIPQPAAAQPAIAPRPVSHPALMRVNQATTTTPPLHRFQP